MKKLPVCEPGRARNVAGLINAGLVPRGLLRQTSLPRSTGSAAGCFGAGPCLGCPSRSGQRVVRLCGAWTGVERHGGPRANASETLDVRIAATRRHDDDRTRWRQLVAERVGVNPNGRVTTARPGGRLTITVAHRRRDVEPGLGDVATERRHRELRRTRRRGRARGVDHDRTRPPRRRCCDATLAQGGTCARTTGNATRRSNATASSSANSGRAPGPTTCGASSLGAAPTRGRGGVNLAIVLVDSRQLSTCAQAKRPPEGGPDDEGAVGHVTARSSTLPGIDGLAPPAGEPLAYPSNQRCGQAQCSRTACAQ